MITDARTLDATGPLDHDICIVGAGPAGISLALELAAHHRVCVLDSGGWRYDHRTQDLLDGSSEGAPYPALRETRYAGIGGASVVWAGWCRPLDPLDLEQRAWVPQSGWPIDYDELAPFLPRAQQLCGVGAFDFKPHDAPHAALGPLAAASRDIDLTLFHVRPFNFGTEHRAALESAANLHVFTHATALRLVAAPGTDRVGSVEARTLTGKRLTFTSRKFVLAAGGIENARLLLLSGDSPELSLGNTHGNVGRYFMEHGFLNSGSFIPTDPSASHPFNVAARLDVAVEGGVRSGFRLNRQAMEMHRLMGCAMFFHPAYEAHSAFDTDAVQAALEIGNKLKGRAVPGGYASRLLRAARDPVAVITATARRLFVREGPQRLWRTRAMFECAPDAGNRITLGGARDEFGRPLAVVNWRPLDADIESVRATHELFDAAFRRSGSGTLRPRFAFASADDWRPHVECGKHHMGTTRMHRDARNGVVDADCKVHGVANLYVAGSSVFPTSGYANPTLTLVALALRLARHLNGH